MHPLMNVAERIDFHYDETKQNLPPQRRLLLLLPDVVPFVWTRLRPFVKRRGYHSSALVGVVRR
jgi:hypothetical protein